MRRVCRFVSICVAIVFSLASFSVANAQEQAGKRSGTWLLTGVYCSSGKLYTVTNYLHINDDRLTISGEENGTTSFDQPAPPQGNGRAFPNCRHILKSRFTISSVGGMSLLNETARIDVTGDGCGRPAGATSKSNYPDGSTLIDVHGDTLRFLSGGSAQACDVGDVIITVFKRVKP